MQKFGPPSIQPAPNSVAPRHYKSKNCNRHAGISIIKGETLLHNVGLYRSRFFFLMTENEPMKLIDFKSKTPNVIADHMYYIVNFYGQHDAKVCGQANAGNRYQFNEEQETEIDNHLKQVKNLSLLRQFYEINFQRLFRDCTYAQLWSKADSIFRKKYDSFDLISQLAKDNNLIFEKLQPKDNIHTSLEFFLANPDYYKLFETAECDTVYMDFTFIKIGTHNFAIHFLASMLPSRFSFILAAYIRERIGDTSAEDLYSLERSLDCFNQHCKNWKNAKLLLTDDGKVYELMSNRNQIPATMLHQRCGFHYYQNFARSFNSKLDLDQRQLIHDQFFRMLRSATDLELQLRYELLGALLDQLKVKSTYYDDLQYRKSEKHQYTVLQEMAIATRKEYGGLTLGVTTTQSLEGANYNKLKLKLKRQSTFYDLVFAISGCDVWEINAIAKHLKTNSLYRQKIKGQEIIAQGFVLKVQELLLQQKEYASQYQVVIRNEKLEIQTETEDILMEVPVNQSYKDYKCNCVVHDSTGIVCSHMFAVIQQYFQAEKIWTDDQIKYVIQNNINQKYSVNALIAAIQPLNKIQLYRQLPNFSVNPQTPDVSMIQREQADLNNDNNAEEDSENEHFINTEQQVLEIQKFTADIRQWLQEMPFETAQQLYCNAKAIHNGDWFSLKNQKGNVRGTSNRIDPMRKQRWAEREIQRIKQSKRGKK